MRIFRTTAAMGLCAATLLAGGIASAQAADVSVDATPRGALIKCGQEGTFTSKYVKGDFKATCANNRITVKGNFTDANLEDELKGQLRVWTTDDKWHKTVLTNQEEPMWFTYYGPKDQMRLVIAGLADANAADEDIKLVNPKIKLKKPVNDEG